MGALGVAELLILGSIVLVVLIALLLLFVVPAVTVSAVVLGFRRHQRSTSQPGWYGDPETRNQARYWTGSSWTEHVSNDGVVTSDPVASG